MDGRLPTLLSVYIVMETRGDSLTLYLSNVEHNSLLQDKGEGKVVEERKRFRLGKKKKKIISINCGWFSYIRKAISVFRYTYH